MIAAAPVLASLYLSLAAVIGLWALHRTLDSDDPITRRFIFGVRVTMLLFAGRALMILTGGDWFRVLVLLAGALVPLAVLILTEGLLRRHAPVWAKALIGAGALTFIVLALMPGAWVEPMRTNGLLLFQIIGLCISGWLVVRRDKASLTQAENLTVARLALSLFILVPLIAVDYLTAELRVPVQMSAIGVLVLCWLAVGLNGVDRGHRATMIGSALILAAGLMGGGILGLLAGGGRDAFLIAISIALATVLVVVTLLDTQRQRRDAQSLGLLRHLAEGPLDSPLAFLRGLQSYGALEGAVLVEGDALEDCDPKVLDRLFAAYPVLRPTSVAGGNATEADHAAHLFNRYDASHIFEVSQNPRQLIAISIPALGLTEQTELEVQAVQRMASLVSDRTA